ncbi:MAG: hypothetical protein ACI9G1_001761, partial [Pirellulaceae bacterium]
FGLQYLGWRSTSLGLGELTPGYCGNAFGVKRSNCGINSNHNMRDRVHPLPAFTPSA